MPTALPVPARRVALRRIGVTLSGLVPGGATQLDLLDGDERESLPDANEQTAGEFSNDAGRGDAGVVLQAIPQLGKIGSLNVGTAAAIAMYETRRAGWTAED